MPERENIFSWRRELPRGNTREARQARADFYYERLVDDFRQKVGEAERRRASMDYERCQQLLDQCAGEKRQGVIERRRKYRTEQGVEIPRKLQEAIDLGFAGFSRIGHVNLNSWAKKAAQREGFLNQALVYRDRHESVRRTTDKVWESIHGGFMAWPLEVIQDTVKTYELMGEKERAKELAQEGIRRATRFILESEEGSRPREDRREKYFAVFAARGVLQERLGAITKDLFTLHDGWYDFKRAHGEQPNYHRLATLSIWLISASLSGTYKADSRERWSALTDGAAGILEAIRYDPRAAAKALVQHFNLKRLSNE